MALDDVVGELARDPGQLGGVDAADGDRLSVPDGVALGALDGVGQGVPVVEHLASGMSRGAAGLAEVGGHDLDLDPDRALDELPQDRGLRRQGGGVVPLDQVEDHRIGDEPALDHLAQAGDELVARQAREGVEVAQHARGFVEGADEVLPGVGVDAGLAADCGVDHAEEGGGHVHDGYAAQPGRGHEAAEVGGGPAADGHDRVRAGESGLAQSPPAVGGDVSGLRGLAVGHAQVEDVVPLQGGPQRLDDLGQPRGSDHGHPLHAVAQHRRQPVAERVPDHDVVRRRAGDVQHGVTHP